MGWFAVVPSTGQVVVGDRFESKIDKYIRQQRKQGTKLKKRQSGTKLPPKWKIQQMKEQGITRI